MPNPNIEINALDGQQVAASTLRLANFQGNPGNGIILPGDLKVKALNVPGNAVQVIRGPSGGASLVNPAAGAQAYVTHTLDTENVLVPATDSSGPKTRYIIQHMDTQNDPGCYHKCVDSLAAYANVPHTVLASINQPASTATITNDLITDLREVANPRKEPFYFSFPQIASDNDGFLTATGPDGEWWPNVNGSQSLFFPEWATHMHVEAKWLSVRFEAGSGAHGDIWVEFGPYARPSVRERAIQRFRFDAGGAANNVTRQWPEASQGNVFIPKLTAAGDPFRGATHQIVMKGRLTGGSGVQLDGASGIKMSGWFLQQPE